MEASELISETELSESGAIGVWVGPLLANDEGCGVSTEKKRGEKKEIRERERESEEELVEEKKRQTHKVIISAIFSVGALLNVLWFYVLPSFEIVLLAFYGLPLLIVGVLFLLFFKDTPASLITKYSA